MPPPPTESLFCGTRLSLSELRAACVMEPVEAAHEIDRLRRVIRDLEGRIRQQRGALAGANDANRRGNEFARKGGHFEALVTVYRFNAAAAAAVAIVCDEWLDTSGALLGRVRRAAAAQGESV